MARGGETPTKASQIPEQLQGQVVEPLEERIFDRPQRKTQPAQG